MVFAQAITQVLPCAASIGLSRRSYFTGTALLAVALSLGAGVVVSALTAIEDATGGWGTGLTLWATGPMDVDDPIGQVFVFAGPMLALAFLGLLVGAAHERWGTAGAVDLVAAAVLGLGTLIALGPATSGAGAVVSWIGAQSVFVLTAGVPVLLAIA